jgi:hypothetical protein
MTHVCTSSYPANAYHQPPDQCNANNPFSFIFHDPSTVEYVFQQFSFWRLDDGLNGQHHSFWFNGANFKTRVGSFPRKPESSIFNLFWTPASAGVTDFGVLKLPQRKLHFAQAIDNH